MNGVWRWTSAVDIGTAHLRNGLPCQDFALCMELRQPTGSVLVGVVSDGAGSASHAETGARIVCTGFLREVQNHFATGATIDDLGRDQVLDWLDSIRERIGAFANRNQLRPRDCAATLVGVLAGPRNALVVHIGDGAGVVREEGTRTWIVPSWPFQGEYASMTSFVTDDPEPRLSVVPVPARLDRIALFSDGIERLVLDHANRVAHSPFFDRIAKPIEELRSSGHSKALSKSLGEYLGSKPVCDRTDDDKSLILAVR